MPLSLQAKLLRVLMDQQVTRVGSTQPRQVDARVLIATHRDLEKRVKEGAFREDLYYRIHVVPVTVPPLRERAQDIPALVEHFLEVVSRDLKVSRKSISPEALARLRAYAFPGNVRELRNVLEHACILSAGAVIQPSDLPLSHAAGGDADPRRAFMARLPREVDARTLLAELEKDLLKRALADAGGVQAEAGRLLGLSRSDVAYKLKKHGLD
jgi:DNA-binding NtrC family response regulator